MRIARASLVASLLVAQLACESEQINRGREDSGVAAVDSGTASGLPFQPGMHFVYRAQLNYRSSTNESRDAIYEVAYTIQSVQDGTPAQLTVTASGARTFAHAWDLTSGAGSWAALAGPANDGEVVSPAVTTVDLSKPPLLPPFPKRLPLATVFFLDMRQSEAIRMAFADAYPSIGPQFIAPAEDPNHHWVLALNGRDPTLEFYPDAVRKRTLSLAYDPSGWLVEIRERLGDPAVPNTPSGSFSLTLLKGP
jgi:hypothetical protein